MSETHNIRDRVAFSNREIEGRNSPYEKWVQCGPNSWLVETGAICIPFVEDESRPCFFSAIYRTASVALFCGSDSSSKNVVFFLVSQQVSKIIALEALNSSSFQSQQFKPYSGAPDLQQAQGVDLDGGSGNSNANESSGVSSPSLFCANTSSEGERCLKDTVHPIGHPSVHPRISGKVRSQRGCASRNDQFGRGQNTGLGWSDPTFVHVSVPTVIRGVAPAQVRSDRAEYFVRVQTENRTTQNTVWNQSNTRIKSGSRKGGHSHAKRRWKQH